MSDTLSEKVRIVEVGPRDGLQNEPSCQLDTVFKLELIKRLINAGCKHIEVASMVSAKKIPQMADSSQVLKALPTIDGVQFSALTPNLKGAENALRYKASEFAIFTAVSEQFCQKNINCSVTESLQRFEPILALAKKHSIPVRGYISTVMGCPYSGEVNPDDVARLAEKLISMGCYEISLGDTTGVGTLRKTERLISTINQRIGLKQLAVHFHDTRGQALVNIHQAIKMGIRTIDSAVAGLGGCPYAKGASGNVATEDLLYMLDGLGLKHGIDLDEMIKTSHWLCNQLKIENRSKVSRARAES